MVASSRLAVLYPLLSTGSTKEAGKCIDMTEKLLTEM